MAKLIWVVLKLKLGRMLQEIKLAEQELQILRSNAKERKFFVRSFINALLQNLIQV